MDAQFVLIFLLTFIIHVIGTLAYSVRIAGTRTGRIAVSFALFNILVLISRTSNTFQAPLLAKRVEENIHAGVTAGVLADFRWLLFAAALATVIGAVLVPTFQRLFTRAVASFSTSRSVSQLMLHVFSRGGISYLRDSLHIPTRENLARLSEWEGVPVRIVIMNTIAVAIWTVGVYAALYAGYLNAEFRVTASNLSAVVNGAGTILLFVVIDPYLSVVTDDVVEGKIGEGALRRAIFWMVGSRLAGTVLAQALLIPAAMLIAMVAEWI